MNNAQLKNIIRFSFNFHQTMGNKIHEFDPGYILEKWTKYFGDAKPNPISETTHTSLRIRGREFEPHHPAKKRKL
jgi:hypothetical protein